MPVNFKEYGLFGNPYLGLKSVDPDEMPFYVIFHLSLHCLPNYLLAGIKNEKEYRIMLSNMFFSRALCKSFQYAKDKEIIIFYIVCFYTLRCIFSSSKIVNLFLFTLLRSNAGYFVFTILCGASLASNRPSLLII